MESLFQTRLGFDSESLAVFALLGKALLVNGSLRPEDKNSDVSQSILLLPLRDRVSVGSLGLELTMLNSQCPPCLRPPPVIKACPTTPSRDQCMSPPEPTCLWQTFYDFPNMD